MPLSCRFDENELMVDLPHGLRIDVQRDIFENVSPLVAVLRDPPLPVVVLCQSTIWKTRLCREEMAVSCELGIFRDGVK